MVNKYNNLAAESVSKYKNITNMKTNELYLKTLFCCCACDGEIAQEEVGMIKELTENSLLFQNIQVEDTINEYVNQINNQGKAFLKDYLNELSNAVLSDDEQITLIDFAIKIREFGIRKPL